MALPSWTNDFMRDVSPKELSDLRMSIIRDPLNPGRKIALSGTTEDGLRTVAAQLSMLLDQVPSDLLPQVMFLGGFAAPGMTRLSELRAPTSRRNGGRGVEGCDLMGLLNEEVTRYIAHKLEDEDFFYALRERREHRRF